MKLKFLLILSLFFTFSLYAGTTQKIGYFDLKDVRLLESRFLNAQDRDKEYMLELDADRLLAPFQREAGLIPRAESYTNWESTGLDGHIGGHYLSALSLMYASTGDKAVGERLEYMVSELKRVQDANGNGYIGGVPGSGELWKDIAAGNIKAESFSLNGRWVPLYNIHKTYAGLRDAWLYTGNGQARDMLVEFTDWMAGVVNNLSDGQMQDMLRSEHGGLNETFADVAAITGDDKYLRLARRFSHNAVLGPLLAGEDKLTGMHANTQIPKVLGYKRVADLDGDAEWSDAAEFFWETVVGDRSVCIGGNSVREHFHPADDFSGMVSDTEGPETCNTYNMLRLSRMLYATSPDEKYIDYYERALYNHILSTQHPDRGGFVYFTQMRPGHYRVYSRPHTSFWCCVGSGLENHAKYGEMIYARADDELYVNLFIPSELAWKDKGVKVAQHTKFPYEPRTEIIVAAEKPVEFTMMVRYPRWVEKGGLKVKVNGKNIPVNAEPGGYVEIKRKWSGSNRVELSMPMKLGVEQLPDMSNYYAIKYGPVVLAAKSGTEDMAGLFADDSRGGHIAHGRRIPLKDMPILVSEPDKIVSNIKPVDKSTLTFKLEGLYPEKYAEGMELVPFFDLHESRYIIYWPQATTAEVEGLRKRTEEEERERVALDAVTVDAVSCGQQQPESDHSLTAKESWTGYFGDTHWREARGWFAFEMKNKNKNAKFIRIAFLDRDPARGCDLTVNGQPAGNIKPENTGGNGLNTAIFRIPENEVGKDFFEVKVTASEGNMTPKIVEVRVMSDKP